MSVSIKQIALSKEEFREKLKLALKEKIKELTNQEIHAKNSIKEHKKKILEIENYLASMFVRKYKLKDVDIESIL